MSVGRIASIAILVVSAFGSNVWSFSLVPSAVYFRRLNRLAQWISMMSCQKKKFNNYLIRIFSNSINFGISRLVRSWISFGAKIQSKPKKKLYSKNLFRKNKTAKKQLLLDQLSRSVESPYCSRLIRPYFFFGINLTLTFRERFRFVRNNFGRELFITIFICLFVNFRTVFELNSRKRQSNVKWRMINYRKIQ